MISPRTEVLMLKALLHKLLSQVLQEVTVPLEAPATFWFTKSQAVDIDLVYLGTHPLYVIVFPLSSANILG